MIHLQPEVIMENAEDDEDEYVVQGGYSGGMEIGGGAGGQHYEVEEEEDEGVDPIAADEASSSEKWREARINA